MERLDKPKTKELMRDREEKLAELRQGISRNGQTPDPGAPSTPIAQPKRVEWQLMDWSTYTTPALVLLGGIAVSLIGMIHVIVRYRRARRRRIQRWNRPSRA